MKKIVVTGPECSGKTTLAKALASQYRTNWVPEFARQYLDYLNRPYQEKDLLKIAQKQVRLEERLGEHTQDILICDTDLITIKIWSLDKFGKCHPWILQNIQARSYSLHLLCAPDIPWQPDPQREDEKRRGKIFKMYETELLMKGCTCIKVSGDMQQRLDTAIHAIEARG